MTSQLGGGQHGLLCLVLNAALYFTLTSTEFIQLTNPGTVVTIPPGSTGPQIDIIVRNHKEQLREWQETTRTDQAIQQQLIAVFDEEYLRGLRNIHTGYVGVTTQQILIHLYDDYDVITAVDTESNDTRMRKTYSPTFTIETLFHQIELAVEYTTAGRRPHQDAQVVSRTYLLVLKTDLYPEVCRDWDKKVSFLSFTLFTTDNFSFSQTMSYFSNLFTIHCYKSTSNIMNHLDLQVDTPIIDPRHFIPEP